MRRPSTGSSTNWSRRSPSSVSGSRRTGTSTPAWVGYQEYIGDDVAAITNAAHDKGVRVVPTFQMFDSGSLPKMRAFLASTTAQNRFIGQALDLMEARQADGANLDFEPMFNEDAASYLAFVARFRTAMKARFPTAQLVNATSAGAGKELILGLVPLVDRQMIMTYGYRNSSSTAAGAVAPLDNTTRTVKAHITRILQWAPANTVLLGRAVLRLRLAGHRQRPERHRPVEQDDLRRRRGRDLRERPRLPGRPSRGAAPVRRARGQRLLHLLGADQEDVAAGLLRGGAQPHREVRLGARHRAGRHRDLDARQRPRLPRAVGPPSDRSSTPRSTP